MVGWGRCWRLKAWLLGLCKPTVLHMVMTCAFSRCQFTSVKIKRGGGRQYQLSKLLCTAASWGNSLKTIAQETHKILWEGVGLQPSTSPSRHSTVSSLLGRGWRCMSSRWEPRARPALDLLLKGLLVKLFPSNRANLSPLGAQEDGVVGKSCYWVASFQPTKHVNGLGSQLKESY